MLHAGRQQCCMPPTMLHAGHQQCCMLAAWHCAQAAAPCPQVAKQCLQALVHYLPAAVPCPSAAGLFSEAATHSQRVVTRGTAWQRPALRALIHRLASWRTSSAGQPHTHTHLSPNFAARRQAPLRAVKGVQQRRLRVSNGSRRQGSCQGQAHSAACWAGVQRNIQQAGVYRELWCGAGCPLTTQGAWPCTSARRVQACKHRMLEVCATSPKQVRCCDDKWDRVWEEVPIPLAVHHSNDRPRTCTGCVPPAEPPRSAAQYSVEITKHMPAQHTSLAEKGGNVPDTLKMGPIHRFTFNLAGEEGNATHRDSTPALHSVVC